jgi:hypothetical protein
VEQKLLPMTKKLFKAAAPIKKARAKSTTGPPCPCLSPLPKATETNVSGVAAALASLRKEDQSKQPSVRQMEANRHGQDKAAIGKAELTDKVTSSQICFKVSGSNPAIPDLDGNFVTQDQVAHLRKQGQITDGSVVMRCLNPLTREFHDKLVARREQETSARALMSGMAIRGKRGRGRAHKDHDDG